MFIGHFAVGFAAKRWAPRESLGLLMLAPLLLDAIWPLLILAGVEHATLTANPNPFLVISLDDYPWSHSLLMTLVWAALFGALVAWRTGRRDAALVVAAGVASHWLLDWITHRPDMPLWPGGPEVGLGLWNSVPATVVVEGAMFAAAVALYARVTRAARPRGAIGFWAFVVLLAASYVMTLFGPPPSNMRMVGVSALVATPVMLLWVWWFDRNREVLA